MKNIPAIPPILQDADVRAARDRLVEIQHELLAAERHRDEIMAGLTRNTSIDDAAENLIAARETVSKDRLRSQLSSASESVHILRRAVEISKSRVEAAVASSTLRVTESLRPAHNAMVREIASAMLALAEICDQERQLFEALHDAGHGVGVLNVSRPPWLGDIRVDSSRIRFWLREVERYLELPEAGLYAPRRAAG